VTINAHGVVALGDRGTAPDAGRLEQILHLQESLLLGDITPASLGGRICQGAALVLRAPAVRLVLLDGERIEGVASYGATEFPPVDPQAMRAALAERRPAVSGSFAGERTLTVPIQNGGGVAVLLQIVGAPDHPLDSERVALARYVGTLAAIALRHATQRERLEHTSTDKSEILVAMAHDLRSPLNVVLGYTRLLAEDTFGSCSSEQREVLGSIERYALELLSLLTGVLDLARLDAGREPRRDEFAIGELFDELDQSSLGRRGAEGVTLAWHADPDLAPIRSDRFRIRQILQNLVDNALRFTERGSVRIAADRADGGVRLTVTDTGPGIDPHDLSHLFELFHPGAGGSARGSGTGCGLYLVRRYSESLGGRVTVRSTPGEGTCFTIDLPLAG
jgi:signal transduction histidine kinase